MIKIIDVDDVPVMGKMSQIKILVDEAVIALGANPGKIIEISRDDGKVLSATLVKKWTPDDVHVFTRRGRILIKKDRH